ncbi:MAG: FkbM family methyltransferase [Saprospiraceae bacterium]
MLKQAKKTWSFLSKHPFAKRHFRQALSNWLIWQFRSSIFKEPVILDFIEGAKFLARRRMAGITGSIYAGLHEFNDMGFLLHFLREGDHFVDVGANVGSYTILASKVRKAFTTSFEPIPSTFEWLKLNIAINKIEDLVNIQNKGCSSESNLLKFSKEEDTTNHVLVSSEKKAFIEVETVSLDLWLNAPPILIKIDTEGFETEVLKGASATLQHENLLAIIIELNGSGNRYGYKEELIDETLQNHGFIPCEYDPLNRTLVKLKTFGNDNTIYIRNYDQVLERLTSAPPFELWGEKI